MGIRGLQSYIEQQYPHVCYRVSMSEMIENYKLNNPTVQDVVIVVDGSSCASWILGKTDWVCSGQWREYEILLQNFVKAFQNIGITLVFFFDGLTSVSKPEMWETRRLREFNDVKEIFACIKQRKRISSNLFIIPANVVKMLPIALKYIHGVRVYYNVSGECDQTIASYAAQHHCMAVLAQDTDYVIYNTAPYLSIQHLNLSTMQTMIYCREAFCKELSLEVSALPLLGCLLGNDYISRDSLATFHNWVCKTYDRHRSSHRRPYFGKIISSVKKYILSLNLNDYNKEVRSRINEICCTVYGRSFSSKDFQKSLEIYEISFCDPNLYPPPGTIGTNLHQIEHGDDIYEFLLRKTAGLAIAPLLLNVVTLGKAEISVTLEDRSDNAFAPCVMVYRPIRQRLYHMIFELRNNFLKSSKVLTSTGLQLHQLDTVEERFASSWKNISKEKIKAQAPSLSDDELRNSFHDFLMHYNDEKLKKNKWKVLQNILGLTITIETLHTIPNQFITLCIVINYLIQTPQAPIQLWEIEIFLAQAVHPKASDIDWHQNLKIERYNSRAVHLAALFLRGVGTIFDAASLCGNVIESQYFIPWNFFDGKRFHHCYAGMLNCKDIGKLFSNEVESLEKFHLLKNAVFEGIDMVDASNREMHDFKRMSYM